MAQEFKYSVTRVCLRRGELSLPLNMVGLFSRQGSHCVHDTISDSQLEVTVVNERIVTGMAAFFEQHALGVNDLIVIRCGSDGSISFTARPRRRRPDWSAPETASRIVEQLGDAGPVTEAEARALLKDLPADFDLAKLLHSDGRLQLHGGRWQKADQVRAPAAAEAQTGRHKPARSAQPRQGTDEAETGPGFAAPARAAALLTQLGFTVGQPAAGLLLLDSRLATGNFRVLVQLAEQGSKPDWVSLLEQRDLAGADCLAILGEAADLLRLSAPAGLAEASLWSWQGLDRVADHARSVPLSPLDLESHFRGDGMFEAGLKRFEKVMMERISERGAFSSVLTRLAALGGPAAFQLGDVTERDVSSEHVERVLDQLTRSPFQLVVRTAPGRYYLRSDVPAALQQLGDYAGSLLQQLPHKETAGRTSVRAGRHRESEAVLS